MPIKCFLLQGKIRGNFSFIIAIKQQIKYFCRMCSCTFITRIISDEHRKNNQMISGHMRQK